MGHNPGDSDRIVRPAPVLATMVLLESARRARTKAVTPNEEEVFRVFNDASEHIHLPAWMVMQSGSLAAVFVAFAGLMRRDKPATAALTLFTGFTVWLGVKKAKPSIGRGRPAAHLEGVSVRGQDQTGFGYPSGHAAVALTLALIATKDCTKAVRAAGLATAGITGGARMYVGAHLPLDVAGGLSIGTLCGWAALAASRALPIDPDSAPKLCARRAQ